MQFALMEKRNLEEIRRRPICLWPKVKNHRSLGFARDDKGKGGVFIEHRGSGFKETAGPFPPLRSSPDDTS